jgi:hypothetical protein
MKAAPRIKIFSASLLQRASPRYSTFQPYIYSTTQMCSSLTRKPFHTSTIVSMRGSKRHEKKPRRGRMRQWSGRALITLGWTVLIADLTLLKNRALPFGLTAVSVSVAVGLLYMACCLKGIALITHARKLRTVNADELLATDPRPPVLYLRSFRDDGPDAITKALYTSGLLLPSPEERIAIAMHSIGPFVATGRPGERLPELGATRLYVNDDAWHQNIEDLLKRSQLVVLRAGKTPGFWWEVEQVMRTVDLKRVLFFFGPYAEQLYRDFRDRAGSIFPCALPERIGKAQFLYLEQIAEGWTPRTITLRVPRLNCMGNSAIEQMFLEGLRLIYKRLGLTVPRHSFPFIYKFGIALVASAVLVSGVFWKLENMATDARQRLMMQEAQMKIENQNQKDGRIGSLRDKIDELNKRIQASEKSSIKRKRDIVESLNRLSQRLDDINKMSPDQLGEISPACKEIGIELSKIEEEINSLHGLLLNGMPSVIMATRVSLRQNGVGPNETCAYAILPKMFIRDAHHRE